MKYIVSLLITLLSFNAFAQDSTNVKTPVIVSKLTYGKAVTFEDTTIKFVKVITDSRCPKNVSCIWAGEAKVLVDVLKNGKVVEQKTLKFSPTPAFSKSNFKLFASDTKNVFGINLMPYPEGASKIKPEDYYLQLNVEDVLKED